MSKLRKVQEVVLYWDFYTIRSITFSITPSEWKKQEPDLYRNYLRLRFVRVELSGSGIAHFVFDLNGDASPFDCSDIARGYLYNFFQQFNFLSETNSVSPYIQTLREKVFVDVCFDRKKGQTMTETAISAVAEILSKFSRKEGDVATLPYPVITSRPYVMKRNRTIPLGEHIAEPIYRRAGLK